MKTSRAQSVTEYSICIAAIILALAIRQVYVKRGLQGRYADVADFATMTAQAPSQYEPYYQKEELGVFQNTQINTEIGKAGPGTVNTVISNDSITRSGEIKDLVTSAD